MTIRRFVNMPDEEFLTEIKHNILRHPYLADPEVLQELVIRFEELLGEKYSEEQALDAQLETSNG